ncbi:matrixin family metalloprotease [Armatimonas sp.]|uniref:matrixin family metalloprotease n=1 Tax=Armatimonas sp. TaxID=1872638 RepID=UPI00286ABF40|nr:matrixin family metalloprotease [Armatimonas sp.]
MRNPILLTVVAILGLTGCGASGGNPPPDSPDYFSDLGLSLRWSLSKTTNPFKVFIANDGATDRSAEVLAAANVWASGTGNLVRFEQTSSMSDADIQVTFNSAVSNVDTGLGFTNVTFNQAPGNAAVDGTITRANIVLKSGIEGSLIVPATVHEFGHALGIVGRNEGDSSHSSFSGDIMFPSVKTSSQLSSRDIATLARLYSLSRAH